MNTDGYWIVGILGMGELRPGEELARRIVEGASASQIGGLQEGDVVVVASKVVSIIEGRRVNLSDIHPSAEALALSTRTRKDPRIVELILSESTSYRLATETGPIIAVHRIGFELTSAGVDKDGSDGAFLLPVDPDASARRLLTEIREICGVTRLSLIIADSDGRPFRLGSTVIAIGSAGLDPLRETVVDEGVNLKHQQETLVDLLAAASGIVIGQRGRGVPAAIVRGVQWRESDKGVRAILHGVGVR